ncbi:MAG: methionine biosynthesis protein MetW [Rhodospirillales bacterium]|nr:MAG: methionine biosynthesis protein MetW [Rhodospirillales bacterium]
MTSALPPALRGDLQLIADMIQPNTRVLDVGCGDGTLLAHLVRHKQVNGRGIEISTAGVNACVSAGLSVIQGNAETDLFDYPDAAFDYVVLSQTLQAVHQPKVILQQLLRIGRRAVVSLPNFAHWRLRWYLLVRGRMPKTKVLDHEWYDTPNIHLCSIQDFVILCRDLGIVIERSVCLDRKGTRYRIGRSMTVANLLGEQAVFLLRR